MMGRWLLALLILTNGLVYVPNLSAAVAILDTVVRGESENCDPCTVANVVISAGSNRKAICLVTVQDATTHNPTATLGGVSMGIEAGETSPEGVNASWFFTINDASLPSPGNHTLSVDFTDGVTDFAADCFTISGVTQGAARATATMGSAAGQLSWTPTLSGVISTDFVLITGNWQTTGRTVSFGANQNTLTNEEYAQTPGAQYGVSWELGEATPNVAISGAGTPRVSGAAIAWAEAVSATRRVMIIH